MVPFDKVAVGFFEELFGFVVFALFGLIKGLHEGALGAARRSDQLKNLQFFLFRHFCHSDISFVLFLRIVYMRSSPLEVITFLYQ